jgi:predicted phosphoribosyltransferase
MFRDRFDAAYQLATRLAQYKNNKDVVILAIPRGGLELGYVLAQELHASLDIILAKKIGYPGNEEYAIGAVGLTTVILTPTGEQLRPYLEDKIEHLRELLKERYKRFKGDQEPIPLKDKIAIITDDGVATGSTLRATIEIVRQSEPAKVVVAIPVAPPDALEEISKEADEVVCLASPSLFYSVSQFYEQFDQVDDSEAIKLLQEANA